MEEHYEFTNLDKNGDLIAEISNLEKKIERAVGDKVNLIAYSPTEEDKERL